jgi:hypothetical protein
LGDVERGNLPVKLNLKVMFEERKMIVKEFTFLFFCPFEGIDKVISISPSFPKEGTRCQKAFTSAHLLPSEYLK